MVFQILLKKSQGPARMPHEALKLELLNLIFAFQDGFRRHLSSGVILSPQLDFFISTETNNINSMR